jgi:Rrf2 family protein
MISQTAEYALRAVAFLATSKGTPINGRDISKATQIPQDYLTKVMQELDRAGIVAAQRGHGGGYTLSISPDKLSVLEVVAVISPIPRLVECPLGIAEHIQLCPLHKRLDDAAKLVENAFRETMIAELIPQQSHLATCQFPQTDSQ